MVYNCTSCKKEYSSYKSLWNHNKKFHDKNNNNMENNEENLENNEENLENPREKEAENKKIKLKKYNNIYKFEAKTLGKYKYKDFKGGDIYIIQTEFNLKGFYKIGITTNLYKKLENYYISSPNHLIEPKLYYYYPCKNINEVDKLTIE